MQYAKSYVNPFFVLLFLSFVFSANAQRKNYRNGEKGFRAFFDDYKVALKNSDSVFFSSLYPENTTALDSLSQYLSPHFFVEKELFLSQIMSPNMSKVVNLVDVKEESTSVILAKAYFDEMGEGFSSEDYFYYENGMWVIMTNSQIEDLIAAFDSLLDRITFSYALSSKSGQFEIKLSSCGRQYISKQLDKTISLQESGMSSSGSGEIIFNKDCKERKVLIQIDCQETGEFGLNFELRKIQKYTKSFNLTMTSGDRIMSMEDFADTYASSYHRFFDVFYIEMKKGEKIRLELDLVE